ncbi:hypothetical protein TcasGA2_TC002764 [Tribolium castaneum]|uniref:Uncharacterized protein n=1 Tax=Tribolium castaneum TaxID=7070 RepID=D6WDI8_TRICA|nr:hypothetical protein TcasGA2_TC002764 [Tribolium castaneum]
MVLRQSLAKATHKRRVAKCTSSSVSQYHSAAKVQLKGKRAETALRGCTKRRDASGASLQTCPIRAKTITRKLPKRKFRGAGQNQFSTSINNRVKYECAKWKTTEFTSIIPMSGNYFNLSVQCDCDVISCGSELASVCGGTLGFNYSKVEAH